MLCKIASPWSDCFSTFSPGRKVSRTQKPPAWYVKNQRDAQAVIDGAVAPRVRYWILHNKARTTNVDRGDYVCDFPGCGKSYTTKGGFSHHKLISDKVGTYRQALIVRCVLGLSNVRCGLPDIRIMTMFWPGRLSALFVMGIGQVSRVFVFTSRQIIALKQRISLQCAIYAIYASIRVYRVRCMHHFTYHLKRDHL